MSNPNKCKFCGKEITDKGINKQRSAYCSYDCSRKQIVARGKANNLSRKLELNTGETGQINEMLVAIKLIKEGYKVYLPFDTTCKHDILALKNNIYYKIQVKTGNILPSGNKAPIKPKNNDYHLLAVVYNLGEEIEIIPNL